MSGYMDQAKRDDWGTPMNLFDELEAEFGFFDLDAAASAENALCEQFYDVESNGLTSEWFGRVFVNPPYGRGLIHWVQKALDEHEKHGPILTVMLLPSRTCTRWFHLLYEHPDVELRFIKGRLKFGGSSTSAPFPSLLVIIRGRFD